MKILKVIHGYPPLYNAGSEVYSQTMCHGLLEAGDQVHVFTREEDSFRPDGAMRISHDNGKPEIILHIVNNPRHRDRYRSTVIDQRFAQLLEKLNPDVVHIGHLNHLSTSLVFEAKKRRIPIVFTLHDYWLMCPRGQFMQRHSATEELWPICDGQENRKCAKRCYARYFSGADDELEQDTQYWEHWVERRMTHIKKVVNQIDLFICPSKYLKQRFERSFNLSATKTIYLDYGFDLTRMTRHKRIKDEPFTFGYIGTHIPAKGIHQLITAFGELKGRATLIIWGRARGQDSLALKSIANSLPNDPHKIIKWKNEYINQNIGEAVFRHTDVIVTPSIWVENSPLVIHEAQQARVPIITANKGGMGEYVKHNGNGLTYAHRDINDLACQMQTLLDDPSMAKKLGQYGYLYSKDGNITNIQQHILDLKNHYKGLLK